MAPAVFALAVYRSALDAGFVFDDHLFLGYWCWQIPSLSELPSVLQAECVYRPVRYLSLAVDHAVWGKEPLGYHLTNVLLHAATVCLVYAFLNRLLRHRSAAAIAALWWALHPVHTDVVTYISGRRDVLCALFFMAAVVSWPRKQRQDGEPVGRGMTYFGLLLTFGFFILALASKEMAITLPVVLLLAWFVFRRADAHVRRVPRWVLGAFGLTMAGLTGWALVRFGFTHAIGGDLYHHVLTVLAAYSRYLELVFVPWRLYGDYSGFQVPSGLGDVRVWLGLATILLIWGGGWWCRKRAPLAAFGLLWFGVTMLPVSHIIPHHELLAEHYLYLPMVGLALPVGWFVATGSGHSRHWWKVGVVMSVLLACYVARIDARNGEFRDERAFAEAVIRHDPNTVRGYLTLAHGHQMAGQAEESLAALSVAFERLERTDRFYSEARRNELTLLTSLQRLDEAAFAAQRMMHEFPDMAYGYQIMGTILAQQDRLDEAAGLQARSVELDPNDVEARLHYAITLMRLERYQAAGGHLLFAVQRWRESGYAHEQWALHAYLQGDIPTAIERFEHVLTLEPNSLVALEHLVRLHFEHGDRERGCLLFWHLRALRADLQQLPPLCEPPQTP